MRSIFFLRSLIEFLGITLEEQQHMQTIIGHDEKMRRMKARNWDNDKRDAARAERSDQKEEKVLQLLSQELSQSDVERITGITRKTIRRIAHDHGIFSSQGDRIDLRCKHG